MSAVELNLDGLVGPTHHFGGHSYGNLASMHHGGRTSNPRRAALEGLEKMRLVSGLGVPQAVLPPHDRPDLGTLRRLGFSGSDSRVLECAAQRAPELLTACSSSSAMWTANAATVSPGVDCGDGRVHFTPANLSSLFHRSLESATTAALLRALFPPGEQFAHHRPLPPGAWFADEGAANHLRLAAGHGQQGVEIFVYGRSAGEAAAAAQFPARQSEAACRAVARLHGLDPARTLFLRQHPRAVQAGVFHNDVVALANETVLFYHERAFADAEQVADALRTRVCSVSGRQPRLFVVADSQLPLAAAVESYLFNSQLLTLPDSGVALIAPQECREVPRVQEILTEFAGVAPLAQVHYVPLRQSMWNGGGPACLRLRVVLTSAQMAAVHSGVCCTPDLFQQLRRWVQRHYREQLGAADLADPLLLEETRTALDRLTQILQLGSLYPFQQSP